jgi:hypothetical protein
MPSRDFIEAALEDRWVTWRRYSERVEDVEKRQIGQRVLELPETFLRKRSGRNAILSGNADERGATSTIRWPP